jgi:hypothetical protein
LKAASWDGTREESGQSGDGSSSGWDSESPQ